MIKIRTRIHHLVVPSLLLLALVFALFMDWKRRSGWVSIDGFVVFVVVIAIIKFLINSPSETERQRQVSDQLNRQ